MKILQFPDGWPMVEMCKALKDVGIDVTSCHFLPHPFYGIDDICLNLQNYSYYNIRARIQAFIYENCDKYDIFHFHMMYVLNNIFTPDLADFEYLKMKGKKIIVQHHGSEIRRLSMASLNNPYMRERSDYIGEEQILNDIKQLSSIFDHAIVHDEELVPYIKDYYKHLHLIRHPVDLIKFQPCYVDPTKKRPLVVHAPSNRQVKGTAFIENAVHKLKNEGYEFDFILVENMSYEAAKRIYEIADVIVDQLHIGAHGVLSLEAMAYGKPVICYIKEDLIEKYPSSLPIINTTPDDIYFVLKNLITNPSQRFQAGIEGRKYVEKHHNSIIIANQLVDLYQKLLNEQNVW